MRHYAAIEDSGGAAATQAAGAARVVGLISHLANLGLDDDDLSAVLSLLSRPARQQAAPPEASRKEDRAEQVDPLTRDKSTTVYLVEEQQILREAFCSFLDSQPDFRVLGSSHDTSGEALARAAESLNPDVMVVGVKTVQTDTVDRLAILKEAAPHMPLVLLFAFYDLHGIKGLRDLSRDTSVGCAYLLKHNVDTVEQLTQVVHSVAQGRITLDPTVMEELIKAGDSRNGFLKELSPKELEVLSWMAKGYRNDTIADVLSRDVKTVERHINNIYSKLSSDREEGSDGSSRHPRVQATLTYLRATGLLPADQFIDD